MLGRIASNWQAHRLRLPVVRDNQVEFGVRREQSTGNPKHAVPWIVGFSLQIGHARAAQRQQVRPFGQQRLMRGFHRGRRHRHEPSAITLRQGSESRRVGAGRGTDGIQSLRTSQRREFARAIVQQAVADENVFADACLGLPVGQGAGAVVDGGFEFAAQGAPVAADDAERLRSFRPVAQAHELHFALAHPLEVRVQQGEFGGEGAAAARTRAVPEQTDLARQRAGTERAIGHLHFGDEVGIAIDGLRIDLRLRADRQAQVQHAASLIAAALYRCAPAVPAVAYEAHLAQRAAGARQGGDAVGPQGPGEAIERAVIHRQAIDEVVAIARQRFRIAHLDDARAARRYREDAQAEIVADGLFQQTRIDAAALDLLEYLPRLRLVHRHGGTQLAVEIEGEAGDLLPVQQRKLQVAFQRTRIRVGEDHVHGRLGEAAANFGADVERLQSDRPFALEGFHQGHSGHRGKRSEGGKQQ